MDSRTPRYCRSELARDGLKSATYNQETRVIVNDHREQARSYNESNSRRFLDSPIDVIFVIVPARDNAPLVAVFSTCAKLNGVLNQTNPGKPLT
jgi:hypothetical protein